MSVVFVAAMINNFVPLSCEGCGAFNIFRSDDEAQSRSQGRKKGAEMEGGGGCMNVYGYSRFGEEDSITIPFHGPVISVKFKGLFIIIII